MGRLALAAGLVTIAGGIAFAGPTGKVSVDTEPPGATIYLDDVDRGPVCEQTPCTFSAPVGKHTIILRLDKYEPEFLEITVIRSKKPLENKFKLKSALGTIVVDTPKGALVRVDDSDSGKAPTRAAVSSREGHHVVVTLGGKTLFDDVVEVATGDEVEVKTHSGGTSPEVAPREEQGEGGGGGGGSGSQAISGSAPSESPSQFITGAVAVDVGFRSFRYDEPISTNPPLRPEDEVQTIVGPAFEFWPGRLAGIHFLRGLSLFARVQISPIGQTVTGSILAGPVKTAWASYEGSLRQRWTFGSIAVEASGGYVQDSFKFNGDPMDVAKLPDATYQALRLGGKLSYDAGQIEPYLSAENRIVFSGGIIEQRFRKATATGLRGALGAMIEIKPWLSARIEGALMSYTWTFTYDAGDPFQAKGATDSLKMISMLAAITY